MKKITALALCALLILALAGCGAAKAETTEPTQAPAATEAPQPTDAPAAEAPAQPEAAPAAADETAALVEKILAMEGQPVEDLYDLVGEPKSIDYTPSCNPIGWEDGQLEYDGFTVYTQRQPDGTETIYYCE